VIKAIAYDARAVLVGRAIPWGLAVGGGVEVDPVDDAFESGFASAMARRCVVSCSPILSDKVRMIDQTESSGFLGSQGQVESHEFLVVLHQLKRLGARADFLGNSVQLVHRKRRRDVW